MKNKIYLSGFAALVIFVFAVPFKIPFTINTVGKLLPAEEWIITHTTDGRFQTKLVNHKNGLFKNIFEVQFERGDAGNFEIMPDIFNGSEIKKGQTVAKINSNITEQNLIELKGELEETKASLKLFAAGEKDEIINEIKSKVAYAEKQAEEENKIYLRQKAMFEKDLISEEEYEIYKGRKELADLNITTLKAGLEVVNSGAKKEQIDFLTAKLSSLEKQIEKTEELQQKYNLTSPINGYVSNFFTGDTILIVSNADEYMLVMPVEIKTKSLVKPEQNVEIEIPQIENSFKSAVTSINKQPQLINNKYYVFVYAELNNASLKGITNINVQCKINCGDVGITEFLLTHIKLLFG